MCRRKSMRVFLFDFGWTKIISSWKAIFDGVKIRTQDFEFVFSLPLVAQQFIYVCPADELFRFVIVYHSTQDPIKIETIFSWQPSIGCRMPDAWWKPESIGEIDLFADVYLDAALRIVTKNMYCIDNSRPIMP